MLVDFWSAAMASVKRVSLAVSLLVTCATAASADWQYTHWGMTAAQVVAASHGTISLGEGAPGDRIDGRPPSAVGTYASGDYNFKINFYFGPHGLDIIHMTLSSSGDPCFALRHDLDGIYGKPFDTEENAIIWAATWHDAKTNNFVDYTKIGNSCSLSYKPLVSHNGGGL